MHGLSLAWSYFPHSFSIPCNNLLTPMQIFNDDEISFLDSKGVPGGVLAIPYKIQKAVIESAKSEEKNA